MSQSSNSGYDDGLHGDSADADNTMYQDDMHDSQIQHIINSVGKMPATLAEKLRRQLGYTRDRAVRETPQDDMEMHAGEPALALRRRHAATAHTQDSDVRDATVSATPASVTTSSKKRSSRSRSRRQSQTNTQSSQQPDVDLTNDSHQARRPAPSPTELNEAQLQRVVERVGQMVMRSWQAAPLRHSAAVERNPMTDPLIPRLADTGQANQHSLQQQRAELVHDIHDDAVMEERQEQKAMQESVQMALSVKDTLMFPYNDGACHGNWRQYVEVLLKQLDKPSKALEQNLTVMGAALTYLSSHAYDHVDILTACEVLAARVATIMNAASAGNTAAAYSKFEVLMPTAVQTNSAMGMIPPDKLKALQQHTKMLSQIQPVDTNKQGNQRGVNYRQSQQYSNSNRFTPYAKKNSSSGNNSNRQSANNNSNSSRHTQNSGSSSAAAQQ